MLLDGRACDTWTGPQWRRQVVYQAAESAWWALQVCEHFPLTSQEEMILLLHQLGLPATALQRPVARVSTGERQRLALARSLAFEPAVLLLG